MFIQKLNGIINNLPLVLSDTTDVKDVSLNRIIILLQSIMLIFITLYSMFFDKTLFTLLSPYATPFFVFYGGLLGTNVAKKWAPNNTSQGPAK